MSFNDLMSKVRYWDTLTAKWLMRHFYVIFFQIVLVAIFFFWFVNLFNIIDTSTQIPHLDLQQRMLSAETINTTIIVFLLLLNSFWMLFIFNSIQNLRSLLKDISYHLSRLRLNREKPS